MTSRSLTMFVLCALSVGLPSGAAALASSTRIQPAISLISDQGSLVRFVSASEIKRWNAVAADPSVAPANAARARIAIGEVDLISDSDPVSAIDEFDEAISLDKDDESVQGLATYDTGVASLAVGDYFDADHIFSALTSANCRMTGFSRGNAALWERRSAALLQERQDRARLGIPEPPRLDPRCGAAAVAACLEAHGVAYGLNVLLQRCHVTGEGSTLADLIVACKSYGLSASAVAADDSGIRMLPKPIIAHTEHDHFVAITAADKLSVTYTCSDCGAWPGGSVRLTWNQWHKLQPDVLCVVTTPKSSWRRLLAEIVDPSGSSGLLARVASTNIQALRIPGLQSTLPALILLKQHVIAYDASPTGVNCGMKPTAAHPSPWTNAPNDGDPVNAATGEEDYSAGPDMTVYNPEGPSISFSRQYESMRSPTWMGYLNGGPYVIGNYSYECNDFGEGWSQSYNVLVYDPAVHPAIPTGGSATFLPLGNTYSGVGGYWNIYNSSGTLLAYDTPGDTTHEHGWSVTVAPTGAAGSENGAGCLVTLSVPPSQAVATDYYVYINTSYGVPTPLVQDFDVTAAGGSSLPPPPSSLEAAGGSSEALLEWSAVSAAASYNVYRKTSRLGSYTLLASGLTTTSFTDTSVTNGTNYYYAVAAVNSGSDVSPLSNEAMAKPNTPAKVTSPIIDTAMPITSGLVLCAPIYEGTGTYLHNIVDGTTAPKGAGWSWSTVTGIGTVITSDGTAASTFFTPSSVPTGDTSEFALLQTSASGQQNVFGQDSDNAGTGGWGTSLFNTSDLVVAGGNQVVVGPMTAQTGLLQLGMVWQDGYLSYYVNGSSDGTDGYAQEPYPLRTSAPHRWYIGGAQEDVPEGSGNGDYASLDGSIGAAYAWDRAISAQEMALLEVNPYYFLKQGPASSYATYCPQALTAAGANGVVSLSWQPVAGAASYNLYRSGTSGGEGSTPLVTGLTANADSDTTVANSSAYFYFVTSVTTEGVESVASNEAAATPASASTIGSAPVNGPKYLTFPNGSSVEITPQSGFVPGPTTTGSTEPSVPCSVAAGSPYEVSWDYTPVSQDGYYAITFKDRTQWVTGTVNPSTQTAALSQIVDRDGNAIQFIYSTLIDAEQRPLLSSIYSVNSGAPLLTISRALDGTGNITSISDNHGRSVYYQCLTADTYDSLLQSNYVASYQELDAVSQIVPTGTTDPFSPSDPSNLLYAFTYSTVGNGIGTEYYPSISTVTTPTLGSAANTTTYTYTSNGSGQPGPYVATVVDANGNKRTYTQVDGTHTAVQISNSSGTVLYYHTIAFDSSMRETGDVDYNSRQLSAETYGASLDPNDPSDVYDGNNNHWQFTYDQFGNILTETTPRTTETTYTWSYSNFPLGELESVQEGAKYPTSFAYDETHGGRLQSVYGMYSGMSLTDPNAPYVLSHFTYDSLGNVSEAQQLGPNSTPSNNPSSLSTYTATTYNYTTDKYGSTDPEALGEPLSTSVSGLVGGSTYTTATTYNLYDAFGNITSLTDADGNATNFGNTAEYPADGYDLANQLLLTTYPATGQTGTGNATVANTYAYVGGPLTSAATYDESGDLTRNVTLTLGNVGEVKSQSALIGGVTKDFEDLAYDGMYRLLTATQHQSNGDGGQATTYTYFAYNAASSPSRLEEITYPLADTVQFSGYDQDGNPGARVDGNGVETQYEYFDPESLLTNINYPAESADDVTYWYDEYGRKDGISDSTCGTSSTPGESLTYDDLDELAESTVTYNSGSGTLPAESLEYAFYPDGSRKSLTTPYSSTDAIGYGYDGLGRMTSLTDPLGESAAWTYQSNGWLQSLTDKNSSASTVLASTYVENPRGFELDLQNRNGSGALLSEFGGSTESAGMQYDPVGNRTATPGNVPALGSSWTNSYTLDGLNRLLTESEPSPGGSSETNTYDLAGDPTELRGTGIAYNTDDQRTTGHYTFDADGDPTTYKSKTLEFDDEDRLTQYGTTTQYLAAGYRDTGMRAWSAPTSSSAETYYLYDGAEPVCELNSSGDVTALNIFGASGLLWRYNPSSSATDFYAYDPSGNVVHDISASDTVNANNLWDAYGDCVSGTGDLPFGWGAQNGYYTDSGTGLVLCGHRYYDPTNGRWLNRDPAGYSDSRNLYEYAGDDPGIETDPTGYSQWYDKLKNWANLNLPWSGVPQDPIDQIHGLLDLPFNTANLGNGAGTFWGDPSLNNLPGLLQDIGTAAVWIGAGAGAAGGFGGGGGPVPDTLPDETLVVRGGLNTPDRWLNGTGVTVDDAGNLQGASVNSAPGMNVEQLSQGIPNGQIGVSTVGDVRAAGGEVAPSPTAANPVHATLGGIDADTASSLFTPTIPRPGS